MDSLKLITIKGRIRFELTKVHWLLIKTHVRAKAFRSNLALGWSLIEVIVVIAIMALIITLAFPAYSYVRAKLDNAACVGNLRALHAGLSTKLQDDGMVWAQIPISLGGDDDSLGIWWYEELKPYGVTRKTWVCPGDREGDEMDENQPDTLFSSYSVTLFDDTPNTAYRWFQPWVIERGSNHGYNQGPNLVMPDGRVVNGTALPNPNP